MTTARTSPSEDGAKRYTIACDAPGCPKHIIVEASNLDEAWDIAEDEDWSINEHSRGAWTYCPDHAESYEGKTPSGRRLSGY